MSGAWTRPSTAWYARDGLPRPNETKGHQIGTSGLVLDMARDGIGVALGQRLMAEDDMASGKLVPLSDHGMALGHPYCLVYPHSKTRRPGLLSLTDWLVKSIKITQLA